MTEEKDYVGDLRILMNREMIDSKRFFELQNIFKLMPELIKQAKKNK
jgi:hypothetical protein